MSRGFLSLIGVLVVIVVIVAATALAGSTDAAAEPEKDKIRGQLGSKSSKIRTEGGKTFLWAGGAQSGPGAQWFDFTDSAVAAAELQFGVGKDRIESIDDPVYVSPDDPRLLKVQGSPFRPDATGRTTGEIRVIGFAKDGEARAYPTTLLDGRQVVNDEIAEKPITVFWCPLAQLAVVHERESEGEVDFFGASGYAFKNVSMIFDRRTESLWYPFDDKQWTAVSGPRKGDTIQFLAKLPLVFLADWRENHPETKVLVGSAADEIGR